MKSLCDFLFESIGNEQTVVPIYTTNNVKLYDEDDIVSYIKNEENEYRHGERFENVCTSNDIIKYVKEQKQEFVMDCHQDGSYSAIEDVVTSSVDVDGKKYDIIYLMVNSKSSNTDDTLSSKEFVQRMNTLKGKVFIKSIHKSLGYNISHPVFKQSLV